MMIDSIKKQLLIALVLSCSVGGVWAEPKEDAREVIWLSSAEKSALLAEMRHFLQASQTILQASLQEEMTTVQTAARAVGLKLLKSTPESLSRKLPEGFKVIGPEVHKGFESIADEAAGLGDSKVILQQLSDLQRHCIACHAQYQIQLAP